MRQPLLHESHRRRLPHLLLSQLRKRREECHHHQPVYFKLRGEQAENQQTERVHQIRPVAPARLQYQMS